MSRSVDDLTPYFADPCWMFVLLARQAHTGVIFRRGPTEWWRVTLWDTARDRFQGGQWFRGRLYPDKCDVSPDGKLLLYSAGKHRAREAERGYGYTWTAVSRPPYLTALALWPNASTYEGGGAFVDDRTAVVTCCTATPHPDHPTGPLRLPRGPLPVPSWQCGWSGVFARGASKYPVEYRKTCGDLTLGREHPADYFRPSRRRTLYTVYREGGAPAALFEAHWADWDQGGRLVAAVGGRVFAGRLSRRGQLRWRELAAMHLDKPARMEAPDWARRW